MLSEHKLAEMHGIFKEKPSIPAPLQEQIWTVLRVTARQDRSKLFEDIDSQFNHLKGFFTCNNLQ